MILFKHYNLFFGSISESTGIFLLGILLIILTIVFRWVMERETEESAKLELEVIKNLKKDTAGDKESVSEDLVLENK